MGLFNRKKKTQEIKDDFNYEEMIKKANLHNIFDGSKIYNIFNTKYKNRSTHNNYETSIEKTELIGVFNKHHMLIVLLKYNLEQKLLFDYLLQCGKTLDYIFDKMEILPLTIEEKNEELLSNYSNSEILEIIKTINEPYCTDEVCPMTGMYKNSNSGGLYLKYSINKTLNLNK